MLTRRLLPLRFALVAVALVAAACDAPSRVLEPALRLAPVVDAKVCADANDPICSVFRSTVYSFDASRGALPPGVSNWRLVITQFGGQLDFFGVVEAGGAPIANIEHSYLRFFVDNGDGALGAGDLQVVVRNAPSGATLHCGLVSTLPVGAALPTATPSICETGGVSWNEPGRFLFDGFRTVDLSAPQWEAQGFSRLRADERRALFLVEVGNVIEGSDGVTTLGPATAPATRVDTLSIVPPNGAGDNGGGDNGGGDNGGGDNGGGDNGGGSDADTTAPTITFAGNAGSYGILDHIAIACTVSDAGSGVASSVCPTVSARAYTLPLGGTTLTATATDVAGNTATATTSFTVNVNADDLCALARELVPRHATPLCAQLRNGTRAFANHLKAQRGKQVPADVADLLARLAAGL